MQDYIHAYNSFVSRPFMPLSLEGSLRICLMLAPYLVHICLQFEVLQPFLDKRNKCSWRDIFLFNLRLVDIAFIPEREGRVVETCTVPAARKIRHMHPRGISVSAFDSGILQSSSARRRRSNCGFLATCSCDLRMLHAGPVRRTHLTLGGSER